MGIVAHFNQGESIPGRIRFIESQGVNVSCVVCPQQRYATGEPSKVQGRDRVGIIPNPQGQYWGKIRFIEKPGYQTMGVVMWLNVVLTPRSLTRSQSSGTGPSASCWYCCPLCPTGCRYPGKIRFIQPQ